MLKSNRGFTLIELLVVIVLIAMTITIVMLNINLGVGDSVMKEEARRLRTLLQMASEEAILFNKSMGIRFEPDNYRFYELQEVAVKQDPNDPAAINQFLPGSTAQSNAEPKTERKWVEIEGDDMFRLHELPEDHEFSVLINDTRIVLEPDTFQSRDEDEEDIKPNVFMTPDGELGPDFEIRIEPANSRNWMVVQLNEDGELEVLEQGDEL